MLRQTKQIGFQTILSHASKKKLRLSKSFLGFVEMFDSTGQDFYDTITKMLKMWNVKTENMRVQCYDNGILSSRFLRAYEGEKNYPESMFLKANPRAFFVPCFAYALMC